MLFSEIKPHINVLVYQTLITWFSLEYIYFVLGKILENLRIIEKNYDLRTDFLSLFELKGFVYHWNVFFV